ncbi:MAG: hypothetical protein JWO86_952 [Myxococcaceae bacterium]|nr:hypothetical protein [Myxococcaceae bacterium]
MSVGAAGSGLGPARVVAKDAPHRTTRNAMTVLDTAFNGRTLDTPDLSPALAPMFWEID